MGTQSRREVIKGVLKTGAYIAPVIVGGTVPILRVAAVTLPTVVTPTVVAAVTLPTVVAPTTVPAATLPTAVALTPVPTPTVIAPTTVGTLTGTVRSAATGNPIVGATVTVGGLSAITGAGGTFTIANVPTGMVSLQTGATGFVSRTDTATIITNATTTISISLVPVGSTNLTMVLTWGAQPHDLDSHLSGPNIEAPQANAAVSRVSGGKPSPRNAHATPAGRFHVAFYEKTPVSYASLDVDNTVNYGPETVTVSRSTTTTQFVPGSYRYWVHNFSGEVDLSVSNAVVTVFQAGVQQAQYQVAGASGAPTQGLWHVFDFTLATDGTLTLATVQQFQTGDHETVL